MLISIALIILTAIVVYQDFRFRAIGWYLIPAIVVLMVVSDKGNLTITDYLTTVSLNLVFLLIQFAFVWLYVSIKNKKRTNILKGHIGSGDWLFFASLAFGFSTLNFVVFVTCGLLITLTIHLVAHLIAKASLKNVPLAGYMAALCIVLQIVQITGAAMQPFDDNLVLSLIGISYA